MYLSNQINLESCKIKYKYILSFIILFTLILGLNSVYIVAAENPTITQNTITNKTIPYTSTVTTWYPTLPLVWTGLSWAININPNITPISEINFDALKSAGITDIYVLVTNNNYLSVLSQAKTKADAVGIRTNAWVYPGFIYASPVAHMGIGVLLDVETYNMPAYIPQIQKP